jgi:hypothetical protein
LIVGLKPGGFDHVLHNALKDTTGISAAMWRAKKHNADCGVENVAEMFWATTRPSKHLLYDNPA